MAFAAEYKNTLKWIENMDWWYIVPLKVHILTQSKIDMNYINHLFNSTEVWKEV